MRVILIATGYEGDMAPLLQYLPTPLLRIADRPILFHIVEFLASAGITEFDLILHHLPEMIENELGEGQRWGVKITYHLSKNLETPYTAVRYIGSKVKNEVVLLGRGDTLPDISQDFIRFPLPQNCVILDQSNSWTGWAVVKADFVQNLSSDSNEEQFLKMVNGDSLKISSTLLFSTRSYAELKASNQRFITQINFPHFFPTTAHRIEPGIWISRGVSLHPNARIVPPVFIGEECQIKAEAEIGPNAIIESQTIISEESVIEDSVIFRNSFIGEALEIRNSIVDRNLLINLNLNAAIHVKEDFILGELKAPSIWQMPLNLLERLTAFILLVLLSPIYLFMRYKFRLCEYPVVALPAKELQEEEWKTFMWAVFDKEKAGTSALLRHFGRLPVLWNIIAGRAHFVGVSPRTDEELKRLPQEWKNLYLRSKIGLITLANLDNDLEPTLDEQYASEVFYAVHMNWSFDILLMLRWIRIKALKIS